MTQAQPIVALLPPREGCGPSAFGAVSLSVKDYTLHSSYRDRTCVWGAVDVPAFEGINYHLLPLYRRWYERNSKAYLREIMRACQQQKPALIEVHNRPPLALALTKQQPAPVALHLHNDPQVMRCAKTAAQRARLAQKCAAIYCSSEWIRQRFAEGLPEELHQKLHLIYIGLDINPEPKSKQPHIVYAGRITPYKGALLVAEALKMVLPAHADWHGYIIGGRRHAAAQASSDYERKLEQAVKQAGERVHLTGFLPFEATQAHMAQAQIAVIPSLWDEPLGRTAMEAMAHGCAVITSGRGGLKEVVGDAGVILDDVTAESIAKAITDLIENTDLRAELQTKAVKQVQAFAIERCTAVLDALRGELLQEKQRHAA